MALSHYLDKPGYPSTGSAVMDKYSEQAEDQKLLRSVVPPMTASALCKEIAELLADTATTGAFIYSIQVLQPHSLSQRFRDLDVSAVPTGLGNEVKTGLFSCDSLYKTPTTDLSLILAAVLGQAETLGVSLRASTNDFLTHKIVTVISDNVA